MGFLITQSINSLWVVPILSNIFLFFDGLVYVFAEYTFKLFELASVINLQNMTGGIETAEALLDRIMAFVAVFMLFRLALIFVQYLIDPEKISAGKAGSSKLITNIVVVLIMLTLTYSGFLFGLVHDIQTLIFSSGYEQTDEVFEVLPEGIFSAENQNVIANLISGANISKVNYGRSISVSMLSSFLYIGDGYDEWSDYGSGSGSSVNCSNIPWNESVLCGIARAENGSFLSLPTLDTVFTGGNLNYYPIISTIAGLYLVFTFFKFVSEVLIRALKLFLLEIIAPIAIVTYIEPEDKGHGIFKNYWTTYIKIFMDLFLRIALIYLSVVIIDIGTKSILSGEIGGVFNSSVGGFTLLLLKAFFIFAVLKFIKTAPDMIASIFGFNINKDGKGGFGKMLRGIIGTGVGMGVGISSARRAGLGGVASAFQGIRSGIQGAQAGAGSTNLRDFISRQSQANAGIRARTDNIRQAGGLGNYAGSFVDQFTGRTNRLQSNIAAADRRASNLESFNKAFSNQFANREIDPKNKPGVKWGSQQDYVDRNEAVLKARLQETKAEENFKNGVSGYDEDRVLNARKARIEAESNARKRYEEAFNQELGLALKDNSRFDSASSAAYNTYRRQDPEKEYQIRVDSSLASDGSITYGDNNINKLQKSYETEKINAQSQMRSRSNSSGNNNK